jgi:DNA-binding LacI/PurR family transcriptional regulator
LGGKITLQDIARKLGVSTTTISLALRDHPRISEATKVRVLKLIEQLKYEPDRMARALVMGKSNLIGVIVPNSSDPYYSEVFKGVEDAARAQGYHVLLSNGSYEMDSYAQRVKEMKSLRVDGIIAAPPFAREKPKLEGFWQELRQSGFPLVLVNRHLKPALFHQVSADYSTGVCMIVEMLAGMGHRRVGYISGEPAVLPISQRLAAFRRIASKHRFEHSPALFETGALTLQGGYDACKRLWNADRKKPTAIVAFSDTVSVGALRFLRDQGLEIPGEISVASFDGTILSEFITPKLTTVSTPMYEIGQKAFELVVGAIHNKYRDAQDLVLPVKLIMRESAGQHSMRSASSGDQHSKSDADV